VITPYSKSCRGSKFLVLNAVFSSKKQTAGRGDIKNKNIFSPQKWILMGCFFGVVERGIKIIVDLLLRKKFVKHKTYHVQRGLVL
jgi:hypothetical protein